MIYVNNNDILFKDTTKRIVHKVRLFHTDYEQEAPCSPFSLSRSITREQETNPLFTRALEKVIIFFLLLLFVSSPRLNCILSLKAKVFLLENNPCIECGSKNGELICSKWCLLLLFHSIISPPLEAPLSDTIFFNSSALAFSIFLAWLITKTNHGNAPYAPKKMEEKEKLPFNPKPSRKK